MTPVSSSSTACQSVSPVYEACRRQVFVGPAADLVGTVGRTANARRTRVIVPSGLGVDRRTQNAALQPVEQVAECVGVDVECVAAVAG